MFIFFACTKENEPAVKRRKKCTLSLAMWSNHTAVRLRRIPVVYTPLRGTPPKPPGSKKLARRWRAQTVGVSATLWLRLPFAPFRQLFRCSAACQWENLFKSKTDNPTLCCDLRNTTYQTNQFTQHKKQRKIAQLIIRK